jgi:hypothetical protein
VIDCIVARAANDQGLSLTSDHELDPLGLRPATPVRSEVFEGPHMVDLDPIPGAAKLASIGEEPLKKVRSNIPYLVGPVVEDCVSLPLERDAAPFSYQTPFAWSLDHDTDHLSGTVVCLRNSTEFGHNLIDRQPQFGGEGLQE